MKLKHKKHNLIKVICRLKNLTVEKLIEVDRYHIFNSDLNYVYTYTLNQLKDSNTFDEIMAKINAY